MGAPGRSHTLTVTVGLLEKIAGLKKPESVTTRQQQQRGFTPLPGASALPLSREAAAIVASDARISRALVATKRVGDLLLRQEEAEAKQVKQLAEELVRSEHVVPSRPVPCTAERDACVGCYQHNAADPLKCAQQVKAYSTCATAAFMRVAKTK